MKKLDTAVVLAGGRGTRLKPITDTLPKPLVKINGKPLLGWILEWLKMYKVTNIVVGVAYLKEKIVNHFGDGKDLGLKITYSEHTVEGGTNEGFRLAISRHVDQDQFFALNGDQIADLNLSDLSGFHRRHGLTATVVGGNPRCPFGRLETDENFNVIRFTEKPTCSLGLCNTGIYVFNRTILDYFPEDRGDIEETVFPKLAQDRELKVYPFKGLFVTVNTLNDLSAAERIVRGV